MIFDRLLAAIIDLSANKINKMYDKNIDDVRFANCDSCT